MRVIMKMRSKKPLVLPFDYQQILQGFIYRSIYDENLSAFLHDKGYSHNKRTFKLFTYSRLEGIYKIDRARKKIIFPDVFVLKISSIIPQFVEDISTSILTSDSLHLDGQPIQLEELHYDNSKIDSTSYKISMISPITVYSTYQNVEGNKITQYFSPNDTAFNFLIAENLKRKYEAYTGKKAVGDFSIKPVKVTPKSKVITKFKGFIINAWNGTYQIEGNPELINFAYQVGISSRNSQGFGMFEIK